MNAFNNNRELNNYERSLIKTVSVKYGDLIVVSNTFTMEWEMMPYIALAKQYGYMVHTIIVENRHGSENTHDCPKPTIDKMKQRFEISL